MHPYYSKYGKAIGKAEVTKRIESKIAEYQNGLLIYERALKLIAEFEEGLFYVVTYDEYEYFVQCKELGRDRALFRVYAFSGESKETGDTLSLYWNQIRKVTPADPKDAPLYISWPTKTKRYDKLLKGGLNA